MSRVRPENLRKAIAALAALFAHTSCASVESAGETRPGLVGATPPALDIILRPNVADPGVAMIDIEMRIAGMSVEAGAPFLAIPRVFAGVPAVPYTADDIVARDADGPIQLIQRDDPPDVGGFLYFRHWTATRPVRGDIRIRYRTATAASVPRIGSGPPFGLRADAGGVSGATNSFVIIPESSDRYRIRWRWDLSQMPAGSIGVSSLGEGDVETMAPSQIFYALFVMAGPLQTYSEGAQDGFGAYWLGDPPFAARPLMSWTRRAFGAMKDFFRTPEIPPFRIFGRRNPYPGVGGAALTNSFMVGYGPERDSAERMRGLFAHEMVHHWVKSLDGPFGTSSWFGEGMAEHYARRILLTSGLFSPEAFVGDVNRTALRYYTNARNRVPNDSIAASFWEDSRIRNLPYDRGSLYLADLDAKLRARSNGTRSVDDLLFAMMDRRGRGLPVDVAAWRELISGALGESGVADFEAMLSGRIIVPASGAFGPCFARRTADWRRYELGFDERSLYVEPRAIRGLVEGSPAAQAGVRDGDVVVDAVDLYPSREDPNVRLRLRLRRDGRIVEVDFLPRGERVEAYQWVRIPGIPDSGCAAGGAPPR